MDLGSSLVALSQLLGGSTEYEREGVRDDELDSGVPQVTRMTPGQIGPPQKQKPSSSSETAAKQQVKPPSKDIWDANEVAVSGTGAEDDPRMRPEYEILYKQAVSAEDMFIGLSGRDPSTSSCEDLVVRITLPNTTMSQVELDITSTFLDLRSPSYRLGLHLPHPVDDKNGTAKWHADKSLLVVTLPMRREYDFLRH